MSTSYDLRDLLSRSEVAAALGICSATLSRWQRDRRVPPPIRVLGRAMWHRSTIDGLVQRLDRAAAG